MSKIIGDQKVITAAINSPAGDKSQYVNWDAINDLPEDFEAVVTQIKIDLKNDFSDIGNDTFMPKPELMYL
jgi:hypothetical protein